MSASETHAMTGITVIAEQFLTDHGDTLRDPAAVYDRCMEFSEDFTRRCTAAGIPAQTISGAAFGEVPEFPGVRLLLNGHFATLIDATNTVYDWTARQFNPTADVPTVLTLDQWRSTWAQVDTPPAPDDAEQPSP